MSVFLEDLHPLFNRVATLSTERDGEITGKVLAVGKDGLVVRHRGNARIVPLIDILDCKEVMRPRRKKVLRRVVRRITGEAIKQHLADRHALFVDLCNAISVEDAHVIHNLINHSNLGHYHREPSEAMDELDETSEEDLDEEVNE